MYHVTLQRLKEYKNIKKPNVEKIEDSTIGEFVVRDDNGKEIWRCFTVENIGESTDTPNLDKRIMPRTYRIKWCFTKVSLPQAYKNVDFNAWSDKVESKYHERYTKYGFKNIGLLLYTPDLPSFENRTIYIHIGNYPQDTAACLLLNKVDNKNGTGAQSTLACQEFYDFVLKEGVENFKIKVKEIE